MKAEMREELQMRDMDKKEKAVPQPEAEKELEEAALENVSGGIIYDGGRWELHTEKPGERSYN